MAIVNLMHTMTVGHQRTREIMPWLTCKHLSLLSFYVLSFSCSALFCTKKKLQSNYKTRGRTSFMALPQFSDAVQN